MTRIKLSDYLAMTLEKKGISHVFELSGGMITHILDSISQLTKINLVSMHHEQSAAFAADAYGRSTNLPGIALATSGPGATNLLTGIGSCYFDSVPAIFITGQVNTHELKEDRGIRQLGFQETNIVEMAKPITKAAFFVKSAEEFPAILEKAFQVSMSGRPGPVLIDLPMNIQRELIDPTIEASTEEEHQEKDLSDEVVKIYEALSQSKKPLIIAGRGIRASGSLNIFHHLVELLKIPVCQSLLGLDTLSFNHAFRVGFFGSYGNRWANQAIADSDCLLVLGARLDIRQTGADTRFFSNRKIIHIDCEESELNNRIDSQIKVKADLNSFIRLFLKYLAGKSSFDCSTWLKGINLDRANNLDTSELKDLPDGAINPNLFLHELSQYNKSFSYSVDVGGHQMWAAQSVEIHEGQHFLTSGGMGAMGYALPAAIGGAFATKKGFVVIVGDGSLQLNIQELQTVFRNRMPLKIIVLNNNSLGMIRQFQQSYFGSRFQSTVWGYSAPDFEKISEAYKIPAKTISHPSEIEKILSWAFSSEFDKSPCLVQVIIAPETNVYPKIAFGKPLNQMEPQFSPIEIEST